MNCEARLGLIDGKGLQRKSSELSKYISFNQQKHDCDSDTGLGGRKFLKQQVLKPKDNERPQKK